MPKRKKRRAPTKKNKNDSVEPKTDKAPSPAKKIAAVSSTSQLEEIHVSSCTALPVANGAELQIETPLSPSCFFCTCCNFSTGISSMLDEHMQQHKLKCPWCPFSSLSHLEVIHHCKFKHDRSTEMDTVPCLACMFCDFMTYIMEHLEAHIALKHPEMQTRYTPKMVSKKVSADLRRDDIVFFQTLSNKSTKSPSVKLEFGSNSGAKANPIVLDTAVEVAKDIKREAHAGSVSEMCARTADPCAKTADPHAKTANPSADSVNQQTLVSYILSDIEASKELKVECRTVETKFELRVTEAPQSEMKLEKLYCLTCPYSSVSIDEVKCHTVSQHPVGAAAATYSVSGESVSQDDIAFFCVKQSCTFSSFDCSSYQKHLTECCAFSSLLTVLETTRLKTTIMYILDYLKKYNLSHVDVFSHLASSYLGISLGIQVHSPSSCNVGSQIFVPPSNENVNRSSIASSDHSSPPVTIFSHVPPHNQQTSSAGMPLSYSQQGNIHTPYSDHLGTAQQLQGSPGVSSAHATSHLLGDTRDQRVNILNTFSLSGVPSAIPVNSSSIPSDVRIYSSSVSSNVPVNSSMPLNLPTSANNHLTNVPVNSSMPLNLPTSANNHLTNVPVNSSSIPYNVPVHVNSVSSNVPVNSSNQPTSVPVISRHVLSNVPVNSSSVTANVPGNGSFLHPNQFPVNNVSNFIFNQTGNEKQPAAFTAGPINQGTAASAHNFLQGANSISLASHHQPGVLTNSGQCHVKTGSPSQTSLANNSAALINHGTANILQNFSQATNLVSSAVQQQPGILVSSSQSHYVTYTAPANQTSLSYGHQPGNLMPASLNHGITGNQNQTAPHATDPMVHQGTYQTREHNLNSTLLGTPTQQDASNANSILVFNVSNSDSRLHELAYGNQSRVPPVSFYQTASLNTQNQVHTIPSVQSAGQSAGMGRQTNPTCMPGLHSTLSGNSVEQSSRSQFSSSSVSQTSQFTGQSDSVNSNFGLQTADGPGHYRIMYSAPLEQPSSTQAVLSVSTTSRMSPLEAASAQPSHLNQGLHALRSVSVHTGSRMATSPQQAHPLRPVIISSLPPSSHHQSPAVGRNILRPRGPLPSGAHPRRSPAPVVSQIHRGRAGRQRQVGQGRGQIESPGLPSSSTGTSHSTVTSSDGNDDDVIVTGGFSPGHQQKSYQRQSRSVGFKLPVTQPQSEINHQERQASKTHVAACSSQVSRPPQSRKMVDVGEHFENIVCAMNTSDRVENIDSAPEDDVEIVSVETRSRPIRGTSLEMSQKTRPVDNHAAAKTQNNSVDWNVMDSFSSGLRDVYHSTVNSSVRPPYRPPSNSRPSIRDTVPSRNELAEGNMSSKQQSFARSSAYSEQRAMAIKVSPLPNPAKNSQNRAGHRQISPAGMSSTAAGHKQMQQRPSHPSQIQQAAPNKASISSINSSSKPPVHSPQHPSVVILDADYLTPSRETNKNYSTNKEPHQEVIVVDSDIPAEFGTTTKSYANREAPQDVIVLDADSSDLAETRNLKTSEPTDCVIILDADSSEKSVDKEKNSYIVKERRQAISNARPSCSLPSTRGNKAMSVNHHVNMTKIPQAHSAQHFTPASQGASFNSKVPPRHGQHSVAISPATRSIVQAPRAASASPVLARAASASPVSARTASASPVSASHHPNSCPNNIATQRTPQPAFRGTNVQNRNWPRTVTNRPSAPGFSNSPVSTNVPASSISPVSVSHSNHYPSTTVTQKGPRPTFRDTHFQDKNGPRTVINTTCASAFSNSSVNDPVVSSASIVARSEATPGCLEKASISVVQGKATQNTVMPCLSARSQPVTDSSSKDSNMHVKDNREMMVNKSNQSKMPVNLPALLLAKIKMCANLNNVKTVSQQSLGLNTATGISNQSTSLDGSAKEANPCPRISTPQPGECSDKTGEVLSRFQPLPPPLMLPASSLSVSEDNAAQEATALSGSSTITSLSAMDVEQIIILDTDINESQSTLPSMDSEQIFILDIDVDEQHPMQDQPENQQNLMLNASSDMEMTERNTQFSPDGDRTEAVAPSDINLLNSAPVSENSTLAGRKPREGIKKRGVDETGKSFLEKTKKQKIGKICVNAEKESENKDSVVEERAVRHSDRLLKTVIKDLQKNESDIDAQLSSGSEFPIDDEDLGGDSDSEWSDSPEKKNKVKQKRVVKPADPTAFNVSLRSNYKCWLCRMVYSRCMYAKQHIVNKHSAGLCAIDLDRSKEANSICLLLFCPRTCKYATSTLEAMNSHLKICNAPFLMNRGIPFMEVNRHFLDQTFNELLNMSLEAVLHPVTTRKPRDPAKVQRARKPKAALGAKRVSRPSYGTPNNVVPFPNTNSASSVPGTPLSRTAADRPVVSSASQNASFKAQNVPAERQHQAQKYTSHGPTSPAAVRTQVSHQQRSNCYVVNNSQLPMQHTVSPTSRAAVSKDIPPNFKLQHVHTRLLPSLKSPEQQKLSTSNSSAPSNVSSSHHLNQPCRMDHSTEHEEIGMVEDNGIICLE